MGASGLVPGQYEGGLCMLTFSQQCGNIGSRLQRSCLLHVTLMPLDGITLRFTARAVAAPLFTPRKMHS
jgi:hypothetical protein